MLKVPSRSRLSPLETLFPVLLAAIAAHAAPAARVLTAASGSRPIANAAGMPAASDMDRYLSAGESVPGEALVKFKPEAETLVRARLQGASALSASTSVGSLKGLENRFHFKGIKLIQEDPYDAITRKLERLKALGAAPGNAKRDRSRKRLERAQTRARLSNRGRVYKMKFEADGEAQKRLFSELEKNPDIEWVQPNHIYRTRATTPDDPSFPSQGFLRTIRAPEAWDATTGSESVVVAVIDVGVDWTHPDLASNIWNNEDETDGNGIDNDGNGFIDDVRGWDFVDVPDYWADPGEDFGVPDNNPMDFNGHGTHVSGIVAGRGNNGQGISGVTWKTKIMPLRAGFSTPGGGGSLTDDAIIGALRYAALNGADIINMSFGSPYYSQAQSEAVRFAYDAGCLLIAAAGNSATPLKFYPADLNGVISVAATTEDFVAPFSNYGANVDIAAPGYGILSTVPGNGYRELSGTSMASPVVAGVAALVMAAHPDWTRDQVAHQLSATATDIDAPNYHMRGLLGSGLVNAALAVGPYYSGRNVHAAAPLIMDTQGNRNGLAETGETVDLRISVRNYGSADSFSARIRGSDPYVQVVRGDADYGFIGEGISKNNSSSPFLLKIAGNVPEDYQTSLSMDIYSGAAMIKTEPIDLNRINSRWGGIHVMDSSGNGNNLMLRLSDGKVISIMLHYSPPHSRVSVASRSPDGSWNEPYFITPSDRTVYDIAATVDDQMNVHIAYIGLSGEFPHCDIFHTSLDHGTGTWSPERQVTFGGDVYLSSGGITMAAEPGGKIHLVWKDNRIGGDGLYSKTITGAVLSGETFLHGTDGLGWGHLHAFSLGDGSRTLLYQVDERDYKRSGTPGGWGPESVVNPSSDPFEAKSTPFVYGNDLYRLARSNFNGPMTLQKMGADAWAPAQTLFSGYYLGLEYYPPFNSALSLFDPDNMEFVGNDGGPHTPPFGSYGISFNKMNLYGQRKTAGAWSGFQPYDDYAVNYHREGLLQQSLVNDGVKSSYLTTMLQSDLKWTGNYLYRTTEPVAIGRYPARPVINLVGAISTAGGIDLSFDFVSTHPQGIRFYEYALGTLPGQNDLADWAIVPGPNAAMHINKSEIAADQEFYLSVRAHSKGVYSSALAVSAPLMASAFHTPIADAGPDRAVEMLSTIILDGGASSDPECGPQGLAYAWTQISGPIVAIANAGSVQAAFTPTEAGDYGFRLTVNNGAASAFDDVLIIVTPLLRFMTTFSLPEAGGIVSGGGPRYVPGYASMYAAPAPGYVFTNWAGDLTGSENPTSFYMTDNATVIGVFNPQILIPARQTAAAATSSSNETGHPAAHAIDGNAATTRWSSAFSDPQRITFDMGSPKSITTVVLDWEGANAKNYTLEGSNDPSFAAKTILVAKTNMPAGNHRIDSLAGLTGSYRYYRMNGTARNTAYGYSIWEARFYTSTLVTVYNISASAGANGAISPSGTVAVNQGSSKTFTITPAAGYVVDAVLVNGIGQGPLTSYTFSNVSANHSISATFKPIPIKYSLTVTATNGSVTLSPAGGSYVSGTVVTLTAAPNAGYNFGSWSGAVTGTANPVSVTMNANKNVTATFKKDPNIPLPGRVQAEDYRIGGEGIGYHDLTAGNSGGQYRTDNVDIQATTDAGGGYNVGWIQAGEWLAYDVKVGTSGAYNLTARMASATAGTKSAVLSVDGVNLATFSFTDASGNQSWKNVTVTGVNLTAGVHVMRVTMSNASFNLNYIDVLK